MAALTMPSLVANYQEQAINSQFKKVYSAMFQALNLMQADGQDDFGCNYGTGDVHTGCEQFFDDWTANMKVIKTCRGNAFADGCIAKYNGYDTLGLSASGCSGWNQSSILTKSVAYVLADGATIFTYPRGAGFMALFAIDVNGLKGPNKWGHDVFPFTIYKNSGLGILPNSGGCGGNLKEDGGRTSEDIMMNVAK